MVQSNFGLAFLKELLHPMPLAFDLQLFFQNDPELDPLEGP